MRSHICALSAAYRNNELGYRAQELNNTTIRLGEFDTTSTLDSHINLSSTRLTVKEGRPYLTYVVHSWGLCGTWCAQGVRKQVPQTVPAVLAFPYFVRVAIGVFLKNVDAASSVCFQSSLAKYGERGSGPSKTPCFISHRRQKLCAAVCSTACLGPGPLNQMLPGLTCTGAD